MYSSAPAVPLIPVPRRLAHRADPARPLAESARLCSWCCALPPCPSLLCLVLCSAASPSPAASRPSPRVSPWCCALPPHRTRVSPWCCVLPTQPPAPSGLSPVPCASLSGAASRSPARSSFSVLIMEQYKNMGVNDFCDHLIYREGHQGTIRGLGVQGPALQTLMVSVFHKTTTWCCGHDPMIIILILSCRLV